MISVVLPVYNERDNLATLLEEVDAAMAAFEHEVVAVDDCSTDGSAEELRRLRAVHRTLRVAALERHAGQSAAFAAGFRLAAGDVVVTMDADGQNDPADIPALLAQLESDPSCRAVAGYRVNRTDSRWRRFQGRVANAVRNRITGDSIRDTGCSLKVMRRSAVLDLPLFDGMHRFYPTLIRHAGGLVVEAPVSHRRRLRGRSKYGMWNRGLRTLRDAFGVRWLGRRVLRYSVRKETD